ncbi:MAG: hypothetical protein HRU12_23690 [Phaeodactylibacter sp.]|nr:hypothetical protein [Phaeodactylibacter sp.]
MALNSSGFDRKIQALSRAPEIAGKLARDGALYIQHVMIEEVLNGPAGKDYPKTGYPASVAPGASGFVGVNSGNLRRSVQVKHKKDESIVFINQGGSGVDYANYIAKWSEQQYGQDFISITVFLYSAFLFAVQEKEFRRFLNTVSVGLPYQYRNPFPA